MDRNYLASDDRFFFEQEFASLLQTRQYAEEWEAASKRAYGGGDRTLIEFRCGHEQKNLFSFLNQDARDLNARGIDGRILAEHLLRGEHSPMFDRYEFDLDSSHLVFRISEYRHRGLTGKEWAIDPTNIRWIGDKPLTRIVDMDVRQLVLLPRM